METSGFCSQETRATRVHIGGLPDGLHVYGFKATKCYRETIGFRRVMKSPSPTHSAGQVTPSPAQGERHWKKGQEATSDVCGLISLHGNSERLYVKFGVGNPD